MTSETQAVADEQEVAIENHEHEDIHLPPSSIAPLIVSVGVVLVGLGLLVPPLLAVGALVAVAGIWKMASFPEISVPDVHLNVLNNRKLGMWAFLASEVLFFSSLIGTFLRFKLDNNNFVDIHEILNLPLATFGTSVLIISSFAVVMALEALQSDDFRVFRNWAGITVVLGLIFLGVQATEWHELWDHQVTENTMFGTAFYVTTGFHGLHVFGGVGWLALLLIKAVRGDYSAQNYLGFELFGLYWHFVDIVWIVLFTVIYLIQ